MAISAGFKTAIDALSALAQAGGLGYGAYASADSAERDRKFRERQWMQQLQHAEQARAIDERRYQDTQLAARRGAVAQQPMNSLGLLSGLSNLSQGMARSSPLDVLGFLAGGR